MVIKENKMSKLELSTDNQFNGMEREDFKQMLIDMGVEVEDCEGKGEITFMHQCKYKSKEQYDTGMGFKEFMCNNPNLEYECFCSCGEEHCKYYEE
jgi:hypothetical protein